MTYRNCVTGTKAVRTAEASPARAGSSPERQTRTLPALDTLSFDERHAIEQACTNASELRADEACVAAELATLESAPEPSLLALGDEERHALRRQCFDVQGRDGVASYRRCLDEALTALRALPEPNPASLAPRERNALGLRCTSTAVTAADYRRCLLEALGVAIDTPAPNPTSARRVVPPEPDTQPDGPDGAADGEPGARLGNGETSADADLGAAVPVTAQTSSDTAAGEGTDTQGSNDGPPTEFGSRVDDVLERLTVTLAGLDGTERIVLGAALALPLLLLALWSVMRRSRRRPGATSIDDPYHGAASADLIDPPYGDDPRGGYPDRYLDSGDDFLDDLDMDDTLRTGPRDDWSGSARSPGDDDVSPPASAFAGPTLYSPSGRHATAAGDSRHERPAAMGSSARPRSAREPRSRFGRWLLDAPRPLRRQHAIEFLIYWMAYGDERYEPATRKALLRSGGESGDPHDLIKRQVLEQDMHAFADVVRWLQGRTSTSERVQIIDLLMTLLINEGAMTPSQNTLLHFLADALGLGTVTLDERHREAFGTPMPALARADLEAWWDRLEPPQASRWDPRAAASLDEERQCRIRLGLPLTDELEEEAVIEGFRRAARRCHPHRFEALGERERALAERQFVKFEEARDRLLGIDS